MSGVVEVSIYILFFIEQFTYRTTRSEDGSPPLDDSVEATPNTVARRLIQRFIYLSLVLLRHVMYAPVRRKYDGPINAARQNFHMTRAD